MNFSVYIPGENRINMKMAALKVQKLEFEEVEGALEVDKK